MTALTASRLVRELATATTRRLPVAANTNIYEGGMVALSGSGSSAVAVPASANAALKVVGIALADQLNNPGVAGALSVDAKVGFFLMNNSSTDPVAIGDIGATVYAQDDNTISKTGAPASGSPTQPVAGTLFNIDAASGAAWVKFV
jgi:hypothetical protein